MRVVVDTDVMSFAFKRDSRVEKFAPALDYGELLISFMTLAETERWRISRIWGPSRLAAWRSFSSRFMVLPVSVETCRLWAEIVERMRSKGRGISFQDAWIAATAIEVQCPLLTHNTRHFATIEGLEIWKP